VDRRPHTDALDPDAPGNGAPDGAARDAALVCDELALVRAGIGEVLRGRGVEVLAQTRSGREAVSIATLERPALVVCGVPADLPPADTLRRLARLRPQPAIVALLPPGAGDVVSYLLALGVRGAGLRSSEPEELGSLVDAALKGGRHVVPALHRALSGAGRLRTTTDRESDVLSAREREVLALLAEGRNNRQISAELSITLATVKSHLVRIYAKLDASNRNEALGRAVALGLLR
jgi:DNA-binding NarL/FixJ family response regulator